MNPVRNTDYLWYKNISNGVKSMKRQKFIPKRELEFVDEDMEWMSLTPSQRIKETTKLWQLYLALGGSLDPEPDPQSPFYFQEA